MSGDVMSNVSLQPIVTALQGSITGSDIVTFFATGVTVALPIILTWFRCPLDLSQIRESRKAVAEANLKAF